MGYVMTIHYDNLELPEGQEEAIEHGLANTETYIGWLMNDGQVEPEDHTFDWDEDFISDLMFLRALGVRGEIFLCGEDGQYEKWFLDDENIKMFVGLITYPDTPNEEYFEEEEDSVNQISN